LQKINESEWRCQATTRHGEIICSTTDSFSGGSALIVYVCGRKSFLVQAGNGISVSLPRTVIVRRFLMYSWAASNDSGRMNL
jgi:hypothetical protein